MTTLRVPDFRWLIDKNLLPIPTMPTPGDAVRTEDIEAWVKWAYECGKGETK